MSDKKPVKSRTSITVDADLLTKIKQHCTDHNLSVSALFEAAAAAKLGVTLAPDDTEGT